MTCECENGYVLDQTYGYTHIPPGAVAVQACDLCQRWPGDIDAAIIAARDLGTSFGGNFDPNRTPYTDETWPRLMVAAELLSEEGEHLGPITTAEHDADVEPCFTAPGDVWVYLPLDHPLRGHESRYTE